MKTNLLVLSLFSILGFQSCASSKKTTIDQFKESSLPTSLGQPQNFKSFFSDAQGLGLSGMTDLFLFNEELYLKASIEDKGTDTLIIKGEIMSKKTNNSTIFTYRILRRAIRSDIINLDEDSYLYRVFRDEKFYSSIMLSETFNSTILRNKVEFGSGKVTLPEGKQYNYIALDDPKRAYLDYVLFLTQLPKVCDDARCNEKFNADRECPSGKYEAEFENLIVIKKIYCRCIDGK